MKKPYKASLLPVLLLCALLLTSCGKPDDKAPPAPATAAATEALPAHGLPQGRVSEQDKERVLERLEENLSQLYQFEAQSRSKDEYGVSGQLHSEIMADATGYVRGDGSEGFMKMAIAHADERVYWKSPEVYFRVETSVSNQKGNPDFTRVKRAGSLQERLPLSVSLKEQLAFLRRNLALVEMEIVGDNVRFALSDVKAEGLGSLLRPQADFVYYWTLRVAFTDELSYIGTERMLLEWVFNLSERTILNSSFQAYISLVYSGIRTKCDLSTEYRYGLVTSGVLEPPKNIVRE